MTFQWLAYYFKMENFCRLGKGFSFLCVSLCLTASLWQSGIIITSMKAGPFLSLLSPTSCTSCSLCKPWEGPQLASQSFFFFHYARAPHSLRLSYDATVPVVLMLAITPGVRKNGGQWEESGFRASESTYQQKREDMPHNLKIISELLKKLHKWLSLTYVSLEIKHIIDHHRKTFFFSFVPSA